MDCGSPAASARSDAGRTLAVVTPQRRRYASARKDGAAGGSASGQR